MATIRETILNAEDIAEEIVEVSEWGVKLLVRGLSGLERARFVKDAADAAGRIDPERGYPSIVIQTARDPETREPIFSATDRDAIMGKSGAAIDKVADVALRLSGLTPGAVEEAAKN
jgi:hypothetical protein